MALFFPAEAVAFQFVPDAARTGGMVKTVLVAHKLADALAVFAGDAAAVVTACVAMLEPGKLRAAQLGTGAPIELAFDLLVSAGQVAVQAAETVALANGPFGIDAAVAGVQVVTSKRRRAGLCGC